MAGMRSGGAGLKAAAAAAAGNGALSTASWSGTLPRARLTAAGGHQTGGPPRTASRSRRKTDNSTRLNQDASVSQK